MPQTIASRLTLLSIGHLLSTFMAIPIQRFCAVRGLRAQKHD
jgi:hypothetical protein